MKRFAVAVVLMASIFVHITACGGDDGDTRAAGATPTQAPAEPTATAIAAEPAATPTPEPPAAPMTSATAPEPGSDEEQIMAVLEKQVIAVNTADYVAFQETCTPSAKKLPTIAQLKFIYEENGGVTESGMYMGAFSPQGYNVRNVEVKMLRAPFAQATFHVYDYEKHLSANTRPEFPITGIVTQTYEKVDGQWYSEVAPC